MCLSSLFDLRYGANKKVDFIECYVSHNKNLNVFETNPFQSYTFFRKPIIFISGTLMVWEFFWPTCPFM